MRIRIYGNDAEHKHLTAVLRQAGHRVLSDDRRLPLLDADLVIAHWDWLGDEPGHPFYALRRIHAEADFWVVGVPGYPRVVLGLYEQGADECIPASYGDAVLIAKLARVERRAAPQDEALSFGRYRFLNDRRTVRRDGEEIFLTEKEYALALYLFRSSGELVRREDLLRQIWGIGTQLNSRSVDVHLSRVRKKLGLEEGAGWVLGSVYGQGYRLIPIGGDRGRVEPASLHQRFMA